MNNATQIKIGETYKLAPLKSGPRPGVIRLQKWPIVKVTAKTSIGYYVQFESGNEIEVRRERLQAY